MIEPSRRRKSRCLIAIMAVIATTSYVNGQPPDQAESPIPDSRQVGGEAESIVRVANLVYAGTKSSKCFSDHFLSRAEQESTISTSRRFHAVKLESTEVFEFPLLVMTGEGAFELSSGERENLREFARRGGLLLASAGCSSDDWDRSFRREMATIFPDRPLGDLQSDHAIFHMVYDIDTIEVKHDTPVPLQAITWEGRLCVVYSRDGLNDTSNTEGCCCCGGNEITNAEQINVNILAYALTH